MPYGICPEPTNVQAGGGACPFRFRCMGCDHFRTDASYLPDLKIHLQDLLRDRERVLATGELDEWARGEAIPSETEINLIRQLIRRVEHELDDLTETERTQIVKRSPSYAQPATSSTSASHGSHHPAPMHLEGSTA